MVFMVKQIYGVNVKVIFLLWIQTYEKEHCLVLTNVL